MCKEPLWHTDYFEATGSNAFTLMIPLKDYAATNFQLLYVDKDGKVSKYRYRKGKGLAFGGGLVHSTEPGVGEEMHVYICFIFGTDKQEHWAGIRQPMMMYSRKIMNPAGKFGKAGLYYTKVPTEIIEDA